MFRMNRRVMQLAGAEASSGVAELPDPQEAAASTSPEAGAQDSTPTDGSEESDPQMWADVMEEFDEEEEEAPAQEAQTDEATAESPEEPATPETPEAQPVAEESESPVETSEPEQATSETTQEPETSTPEAVAQPEPEAVPQPTEEEQRVLYQRAFESLKSSYTLSAEDAENLSMSPEKVMPKLLAGLHMTVQAQVMQQAQQMLQQVVPELIRRDRTDREVEQGFYNRWPKLKSHQAEVDNFSKVWRQMNPTAPLDDAVENIGKHVMIALGYPLEGGTPVSTQEAAVSAPPPPPAGVSAVQPAPPPKRLNQFEALAEELLEEDF